MQLLLIISSFCAVKLISCQNNKTNGSSSHLYSMDIEKVMNTKFQIIKTEPEYTFGVKQAILTCKVKILINSRLKSYNVTWSKDDIPVSILKNSKKFKMENYSLYIEKPMRNDSGIYRADILLVFDAFSHNLHCNVNYYAKPLVLDFPRSINIQEGGNLELKCVVKGFPPTVVTWYRGNDKVTVQKDNSSHIQMGILDNHTNAYLLIKQLTQKDAGIYMCEARSVYFNVSDSKTVLVRVTDRLAVVWPMIGIMITAVLLFLSIILFESNKNKRIRKEEAVLYHSSFLENDPARKNKIQTNIGKR